MVRNIRAAALLVVLLTSLANPSPIVGAEDLGTPQETADRFTVCWNLHDMDCFADLFTDDADFVNVIGIWWRGREEIRDEHVRLHETRMRHTTLTSETPTVRQLAPGIAVVHVRWELRGDTGAPGWEIGEVRRGILLHVLVEQEDSWRIVASQNTEIVPLPNVPTDSGTSP